MRFSEFNGKEIIDLNNGERVGIIGNTDLYINPDTGEIDSIILPKGGFLHFGRNREEIVIAWNAIRKIGPKIIIVEDKKLET